MQDVPCANALRVRPGALTRGLGLRPEGVLVEVVVPREPREVLARGLAQHPARQAPSGERPVDAAERLEPDEVAEGEDVERDLEAQLAARTDFETFFAQAPRPNPARAAIKGVVCGVRVEEIEEPTMREIRYLDKLVDELAKGKAMAKILREA